MGQAGGSVLHRPQGREVVVRKKRDRVFEESPEGAAQKEGVSSVDTGMNKG